MGNVPAQHAGKQTALNKSHWGCCPVVLLLRMGWRLSKWGLPLPVLITTAALPAGCQLQLRTGGCCTELLSYTGTAVQTGAKTKAEAGKIWTGLLAGFVCLFTKCFCYVGLKALVLKWQLSGCSCTSAKVFPLLQMLTAQRRNKLPYYEIVYTSVTINTSTSVTAPVPPL